LKSPEKFKEILEKPPIDFIRYLLSLDFKEKRRSSVEEAKEYDSF